MSECYIDLRLGHPCCVFLRHSAQEWADSLRSECVVQCERADKQSTSFSGSKEPLSVSRQHCAYGRRSYDSINILSLVAKCDTADIPLASA